ncbi:putative peptidyl-tRNA hydrolase 2 isoform X2 [Canna indica]|uniref:peptidyl-tRNA hydrolase n=1 Tax=Canna indica TaxID=4628 RepID=A0AAQ3QT66_9LILI|nr:putative peptidyl-tRNA hydrolase 2 isoform X2 [Canna indica]
MRDRNKEEREKEPWLARGLKPENFLPGLLIGFLLGLLLDLSAPRISGVTKAKSSRNGKHQLGSAASSSGGTGDELKMVLVVRQDLKMGAGKIASQCAHAATGMYADLLQSNRSILRQWEQYGQAKIVLSCKNQQEMNKLKEEADRCGLPTFVVADAGRTQIKAGSKTVLAIGPGWKFLANLV